jgi:hypothetical protein
MPISKIKQSAGLVRWSTRAVRSRKSAATDTQSHILLFNDENYQRCNLRPGERLFRYDHVVEGRLVGTLSGVVTDGLLECGHSAPFGSIDWVRRREPATAVVDLLQAGIERARSEGLSAFRIRTRPAYFGANETAVQFALLNRNASVEDCEISLGIEAWRYETPEQYEAVLDGRARRTLRQGLSSGMTFGVAETRAEWAECYDLLTETKQRRGADLKISLDYVLGLKAKFGDRIIMHRLTVSNELAGAALVYRVASRWKYLVAWGDDLRHRHRNVNNVMAYQLTRAAIAEGVDLVDIGISSVEGVPDDGLIQFKRSIGGAVGLRINFRLPLR